MLRAVKNGKRWLRRLAWAGAAALVLLLLGAAALYWWWFRPPHQRLADVPYGRRDGAALLLDVFRPPRQNGAGIVVLISGSWKSSPKAVRPALFAPFLRRGYTVFAVRHLSQPGCLVEDIAADVHRAVRFIRHHARDYGIDPGRLGVAGGSSGGHLALLLATRGGPGPAGAADPVDRESSAVQCAAVFFPVTDLLNLGRSSENAGDGGPPKNFRRAFGPRGQSLAEWKVLGRELSPMYHVTSNLPPTLIIHGGADTLVPLEQSEWFVERAQAAGARVRLEVRPGKKHGWPTMVLDLLRMADWFDRHLGPARATAGASRSLALEPAGRVGNPKSERSPKLESRTTGRPNPPAAGSLGARSRACAVSGFGFRISFGLRTSDLALQEGEVRPAGAPVPVPACAAAGLWERLRRPLPLVWPTRR